MGFDKLEQDFDKWGQVDEEIVERMFARMDTLRIYPPGETLFDTLDFIEHVDSVFKKIDASDSSRQIILEAWLLVDYIATYFLRDGLRIPECIERELKLLPFSFEAKITLIRKLRSVEARKLPNQKSYAAFELHPDFHSKLMEDKEFHRKFLMLAVQFEKETAPPGPRPIMRNDFEAARFVPEWWYERVAKLDNDWFRDCARLNKARNTAAHSLKMDDNDVFKVFDVSSLTELKNTMKGIIESLVFRRT
jgi:hypothetical protein